MGDDNVAKVGELTDKLIHGDHLDHCVKWKDTWVTANNLPRSRKDPFKAKSIKEIKENKYGEILYLLEWEDTYEPP